MDRENCVMYHMLGTDIFCDYYDVFFMKCDDMTVCPDNLDDDHYDEGGDLE